MEDDFLLVENIDQYRSICISSLARETLKECEADALGSEFGYFLYEVNEAPNSGGITLLGKVASLDAAFRIAEIWQRRP